MARTIREAMLENDELDAKLAPSRERCEELVGLCDLRRRLR